MNRAAQIHQQRALAEARVLDSIAAAPRAVRRAQAERVFSALKSLTRAGSDGREKQVQQPWWLDPEK